jgi:hypothetical protein
MTVIETLRAPEAKIAVAAGCSEGALFEETAQYFQHLAPTNRRLPIRAYCDAHAYAEAAILLHRLVLPEHGFQLGETPNRENRPWRGLASTWSRGAHAALPFTAATPGLALLGAAAHALARRLEAEAQAQCRRCNGLGWVATAESGKRICNHAAASVISA